MVIQYATLHCRQYVYTTIQIISGFWYNLGIFKYESYPNQYSHLDFLIQWSVLFDQLDILYTCPVLSHPGKNELDTAYMGHILSLSIVLSHMAL